MNTFRCLECGKSSPTRWEWDKCCSPECRDAYDARYAEERARRHVYAAAERQRLEDQYARERRDRRLLRPLYNV